MDGCSIEVLWRRQYSSILRHGIAGDIPATASVPDIVEIPELRRPVRIAARGRSRAPELRGNFAHRHRLATWATRSIVDVCHGPNRPAYFRRHRTFGTFGERVPDQAVHRCVVVPLGDD
jgi:hypothetical protein